MTSNQTEILKEHVVSKIKVFVAYGEPLYFQKISDAIAALEAAPINAAPDLSIEYFSIIIYFVGGDNMKYTSRDKQRIQGWLKLFDHDNEIPV